MKKYLVIFLLLCCGESFGQFFNRAHNYVGVKGGYNMSWMSFYPNTNPYTQIPTDASSIGGYQVGIVFRNMSEDHVGILAEVNYSQKGWEEKNRQGIKYMRKLNYIEVPIMTHISMGKKKLRFFLNIGPSISFLLSEQETLTQQDPNADMQNYYGKNLDQKFDFAFCGGGGLEYRFKKQSVLLEGRYTLSLLNVFDDATIGYSSSRNQGVGVTMTWLYDFH
ncbi:PorT family protein [Halosquirtibacter xylanolyticus]|uniref:porin family protein n=1 Tax=Halosquirtibacter xylanolyticus TaxID=3374599 RepID=UPI003749896A|nr:PorT family protein [Prolixibacteraceae bacterium]